jgi:hypothetical protein
MLDHDITDKINHLMHLYAWCRQEAMEYLYYAPYDPVDWLGTRWEGEQC